MHCNFAGQDDLSNELDVHPKVVVVFRVAERHVNLPDVLLDTVELRQDVGTLGGSCRSQGAFFDVPKTSVPAVDAPAYLPLVHGRGEPQQREHEGDEGNEHDHEALDHGRRPKREMPPEKAGSRFQIPLGILAHRHVHEARRWELARFGEKLASAVELDRRTDEAIDDRGV